MHHSIDRITHTTAFVTPAMEHWLQREIAQWVHPHEGSIRRPIAPWANALTTELHLARHTDLQHLIDTEYTCQSCNRFRRYFRLLFSGGSAQVKQGVSVGGARHQIKSCRWPCSSVVRAFAHGVMGPSWWTHWAISRSNQCSMTGVTKVVVWVCRGCIPPNKIP